MAKISRTSVTICMWTMLATSGMGCASPCTDGAWHLDVVDSLGQLPSGQAFGVANGGAVMLLHGNGRVVIDNQTIDLPALIDITSDGRLANSVVADHPGPGYVWAVTPSGAAIVTWRGDPAQIQVYNADRTTRWALPASILVGTAELVGADVSDGGESVLLSSSNPANPNSSVYTVEYLEPTGTVRWTTMFTPSVNTPCGNLDWIPLVARADNGDVWVYDGNHRQRLSASNGATLETVALSVCLMQLERDGSAVSLLGSVARVDTAGSVQWSVSTSVGFQNVIVGYDGDIYVSTMQEQSSGGDEPGPLTTGLLRLDGMTGAVRAQREDCAQHANGPVIIGATPDGPLVSWVPPAGYGVPIDHALERFSPL